MMIHKVLPLFFLFGCTSAYHPQGLFGTGYASYHIGPEIVAVTYRGSKGMPDEVVKRYALLRAAEVCAKGGYVYFRVLEERDRTLMSGKENFKPAVELIIACSKEKESEHAIHAQTFIEYNAVVKPKADSTL